MSLRQEIDSRLASPDPSALPNARERLLLRAALLDGAVAREAWEGWRGAVGSIEAADLPAFCLLPLVYRNLEAAGVDDPDLPVLKGVYRHTWVTNQRLVRLVSPALDSLRVAGIPTMALNGAATLTHYRSAGARPIDDVDILVPTRDAERAVNTLRGRGWSVPAGIALHRVIRSRHAARLRGPGGAEIDLHWRVLPESVRDGDFWSGAAPAFLGNAPTLAPGPTEQLLHACADGMTLGSGAALLWIADAAAILRDAGSDLDWSRLVSGAAERKVTVRVATSLALVRELVGVPIPDRVLAQLNAAPSGPRERLLLRLAERPVLGGAWILMWDHYRRLAAAAEDGEGYRDFLQYVADARFLPSRRAIDPC